MVNGTNRLHCVIHESQISRGVNIRKNQGGKTCNAGAAERYAEVTEPSILVTDSNTIHIWYLLDALSPKRRANIWNCFHLLGKPLQESIKASPQAWQMDKSYFCNNAELKGAINLSPTWFQQGHGPQNGFPEASWLLKSRKENTSTRQWVDQMSDTNALLSAILHVEKWADLDMSSILPIWSSMYSSMSMMVNQATCYYRDINGWDPWHEACKRESTGQTCHNPCGSVITVIGQRFAPSGTGTIMATGDLNEPFNKQAPGTVTTTRDTTRHVMHVTTRSQKRKDRWHGHNMGDYPPLDFVIPMLNLQLHYNPGMIIAFSGSALEHWVGAVDGDRACLVYYMHANVHQLVYIPMCQSLQMDNLLPRPVATGELLI
ncbi:hypothetical protein F5J12DRAFT_787210 [Pisolithus orientalis]|uniref:uncharacterized protein n=1 Tax=Pisolithus orientalis TaxID=936130 RepID=UPI002225361E|nr:uncharacterized protein F5J12DRAFT_787210 [Pisolithus orientalis]KAI5986699.1 hypothetical protein F5J12DRAFT_787210 [Pisolithus orientalis]